MYDEQVVNNELRVSKTIDNHNNLVLTWESNGNEEETLPAVIYSNSQINFNGNHYTSEQISKTTLGAPIVQSESGTNQFTISYEPLVNTALLFVIKFFTISLLVILAFVKGIRKFLNGKN
ncbi:hypothetical protein GCM10025854_11860 [Tetragenococcus muriaticus]|nr:hypothetical protein GCM10025854_11860 [Tetragenococcus muriaticus]